MRQRENEDRREDKDRVGLAHQMLTMKLLCQMWTEENGWKGRRTTAQGGLVRWSWPRTEGWEPRQHVRGWGADRGEGEAKEAWASLTRSKSTKKWIRSLAIRRNGEYEVWTWVEEIQKGSMISSFRSWAVQEMLREKERVIVGKELHLPKHIATNMLLTCSELAITKACHLRSWDSSLPPVTSLYTSYGPLKLAQTHHLTKRSVTVDHKGGGRKIIREV